MKKFIPTNIIKNPKVVLVAGVAAALIIVATLVVAGLYLVKQNTSASLVKEELNKVVSVMKDEKGKNGGYPASIDGLLSVSDKVELTGGGSFDGLSYCVAATSASDDSIVFHVDSTKSVSDILNGDCESGSDVSVPSAPSGIAVAFASSDSIKLTWNKTAFATSYSLQCSVNKEFSNPTTVDSTNNEGVCTGLKPGTAYFYKVKAVNSAGASVWSMTSSYKTNAK
jgi:hypothetical protein